MQVIIIPSYNERGNVEKIIPAIFSSLPGAAIIVVDDNSPDGTAEVVKSLRKKYKNVHLIKRGKKGGRGSAVIEGFSYALEKTNADVFIEMDADFSHDPSELSRIINSSKPNTVIIASRYIKGSRILDWPLLRRISSRISNLLIRLLLHIPVADNTNGYRCYRKDALEILTQHTFKCKGYIVLAESAYLLFKKGFRFIEIESTFRNRRIGESKTTILEFIDSFLGIISILSLRLEK